ncbi:hypothetical protein RF11_02422 [Thelohanellus kitauei]|uniref:Uncharacterized protein n=1 Tax=Thelohanellus kitauei TaxID=669202 RepID=A0A0C2JCC5_THEKT|nr:hypothetical protein RF11_02422 [Thelohanellus kitauei]
MWEFNQINRQFFKNLQTLNLRNKLRSFRITKREQNLIMRINKVKWHLVIKANVIKSSFYLEAESYILKGVGISRRTRHISELCDLKAFLNDQYNIREGIFKRVL